jgi:hypothetical protein
MEQKFAKSVVVRSGFTSATGEIVIILDAYGSTDPKEIPAFISAPYNGTDNVKGSGFIKRQWHTQ